MATPEDNLMAKDAKVQLKVYVGQHAKEVLETQARKETKETGERVSMSTVVEELILGMEG